MTWRSTSRKWQKKNRIQRKSHERWKIEKEIFPQHNNQLEQRPLKNWKKSKTLKERIK